MISVVRSNSALALREKVSVEALIRKLRLEVLHGAFSPDAIDSFQLILPPKSKLFVFLSSTFTDTQLERNVLTTKVLPYLRSIANEFGVQVNFVDMRWGGEEESTLDHETWEMCARELVRCLEESAGPFFLSLQSDKYGYCPLPLFIEKEVLEERLEQLKTQGLPFSSPVADEKGCDVDTAFSMIKEWYQLDLNHLPAGRYVLKRLPSDNDREENMKKQAPYWKEVLPALLHALDGLPIMTGTRGLSVKDGLLQVGRSVTEYELKCALVAAEEDQKEKEGIDDESSLLLARMLWLHRTFVQQAGREESEHETDQRFTKEFLKELVLRDYDDTRENGRKGVYREELLAYMQERFLPQCTFRNPTGLSLPDVIAQCNIEQQALQEETKRLLKTLEEKKKRIATADGDEGSDETTVILETTASVSSSDTSQQSLPVVINYLSELERFTKTYFKSALQRITDRLQRWGQDGEGLHLPGETVGELLHHYQWGRAKCASFVGREKLLNEVMDRLFSHGTATVESDSSRNISQEKNRFFQGITLGLVAPSGAGKTALMARLADLAYREELRWSAAAMKPLRPVLLRFCGTSPGSRTGAALVRSLCQQIELLFASSRASSVPAVQNTAATIDESMTSRYDSLTYKQLVAHFHTLLANYPVLLFVDSLDQLLNDDEARSQISFLKNIQNLHPDTRIVVSTLPDEFTTNEQGEKEWIYCYQCHTRLLEGGVPVLLVLPLGSEGDFVVQTAGTGALTASGVAATNHRGIEESELRDDDNEKLSGTIAMMKQLLKVQYGRVLTEEQWQYVANAVSVEPSALYMALALRVVSRYTSFAPINSLTLTGGVTSLIRQMFGGIEKKFGKKLTEMTLAFITFSVQGVSVDELQDLLSLDDDLLESVFVWHRSPVRRLPIHVLLRLLSELEDLLVERQGGCLQWYHRQLWEVAEDRYRHLHRRVSVLMGTYFGNLVPAVVREQRQLKAQMWTLDSEGGRTTFHVGSKINVRRCVEASHHLMQAQRWEQAATELAGDVFGVCAKCRAGCGFELVKQLGIVYKALLSSPATTTVEAEVADSQVEHATRSSTPQSCIALRVYHYWRWLLKYITFIRKNTIRNIVKTLHQQPMESVVRADFEIMRKTVTPATASIFPIYEQMGGCTDIFDSCISQMQGHGSGILSVSYSPDGKQIVSGSYDKSICVWDVASGATVATLLGHEESVSSVSYSPDGKYIVSGSYDKSIRIWDVTSGALVVKLLGHDDHVLSVSYSPDGKQIVSGSWDASIRVWNVASGATVATLQGHQLGVLSVSYSPDGKYLVSGSYNKSIRIWDVASGTIVATLQGNRDRVSSVSYSPDGKQIVSGSADKSVRVWDVASGTMVATLQGHDDNISSVLFSPDGNQIVSGSEDRSIRVWDVASGTTVATFKGGASVKSVSFSPDAKQIVSGHGDSSICVWNVASGTKVATSLGHDDIITSLSYSPDGKYIVSGSYDESIRVWDVARGTTVATLQEENQNRIYSVSYSPDGKYIVSGSSDKSIRIWDVASGTIVATLQQGHNEGVSSVSYSPDGKQIVSGSWGKSICVWDVASGTMVATLQGHDDSVSSVLFSPDGKQIVSGSYDESIRVWDVASGTTVATLQGHQLGVLSVSYSPDGKYIVSGSSDHSIRIWDVASGAVVATLQGHDGGVSSVSYSPDGKQIVSGSTDHSIRVWDVASGAVVATWQGHDMSVSSVLFSPDGNQIVSGSEDRSILCFCL